MSDQNEVVVSGRLTKDSELRYTPNGTAVTDVIIASNRIWSKDSDRQEETTFVDVTIWGKQAESLNEYLVKHPSSTFYIYVKGNSMINSGIYDGDLMIGNMIIDDLMIDDVARVSLTTLTKAKEIKEIALIPDIKYILYTF